MRPECIGLLLLLSSPLQAQITAVRLEAPVLLDGRIEEPAWQAVSPLPDFRQNNPVDGAEPTERTELRIAFDERYLYVGFLCFDSQPEAIIANALERDGDLNQDDHVTIVLDTYLTRLSGFGFATNPNGARRDFAIFNDAADRVPTDPNWNTFWDVATARGPWGWSAEFRIPLSSLRYDSAQKRAPHSAPYRAGISQRPVAGFPRHRSYSAHGPPLPSPTVSDSVCARRLRAERAASGPPISARSQLGAQRGAGYEIRAFEQPHAGSHREHGFCSG